jgi:outer membrane immunogenic protein
MKRVFVALVLCSVGTAAFADGVPSSSSYSAGGCASGKFSGTYIGAAVGYADPRAEITNNVSGTKYKASDSSVTFGGYAGYNWQCDHIVLGVETDFNYLDSSQTATIGTVTLNSSLDWYGTVRARAGVVVHDDLLWYVTGGLAYANVDHTFSDTSVSFSQSDSRTSTGWTIGGGAELFRDFLGHKNLMLRVEGAFVDLGDNTNTYTRPNCTGSCTASLKWDDEFWVARVGLTYKFGDPEPPPPLK